jgi:hypothetical protein
MLIVRTVSGSGNDPCILRPKHPRAVVWRGMVELDGVTEGFRATHQTARDTLPGAPVGVRRAEALVSVCSVSTW